MARDDLHFRLRIPQELRDRIEEAATANRRSMTAEIVHRLERGIVPDEDGCISVWLPPELMQRVVERANSTHGTTPEILIVEAVEEAFPYVPTLAEYVESLSRDLDVDEDDADQAAARAFVESSRRMIDENPELGWRRVKLPLRPIY